MTKAVDRLRSRREHLCRQAESQRYAIETSLESMDGALDRADRGLAFVRRIATPPVLVAGGIALALLLRRAGAGRVVATGLTLLGLVGQVRATADKVAALDRDQVVRRSR